MMTGKLILLNGALGSGRTSIGQALCALLDESYVTIHIEQFLAMVPCAVRQAWLLPPTAPPIASTKEVALPPMIDDVVAAMHRTILDLTGAGHNVLVAHMLVAPQWLRRCATQFSHVDTWLVGVHCPLATAEQRLLQRGDGGMAQMRAQFARVHTPGIYDINVDTGSCTPQACAVQIQQRLSAGPPPVSLLWLKAWTAPDRHRGWLLAAPQKRVMGKQFA